MLSKDEKDQRMLMLEQFQEKVEVCLEEKNQEEDREIEEKQKKKKVYDIKKL